MMPILDKDTAGPGETWQELADHSFDHDDLPVHWHLASTRTRGVRHEPVVAAHVRTSPKLKTSIRNPLGLLTVPCTGQIITTGPHSGRCANHARRFGWLPAS